MNAFAPVSGLSVRTADPSEPNIRAFVAAEASAGLFHRPEWSLAVERGCRQRSHYLVAEAGGEIRGILPLSEVRSPLFGSALVSTGFGVGGGIVASFEDAAEALASEAWALAQRLGCPSVELRGGYLPESWDRRDGVYASFARELPQGDEAILKSIPRKQRAEVRRAQSFGLDVTIGSGPADRDAHYRVYSESVRNLGSPVFPRALFEAMLDAFGNDADILTVSKDGVPLASVLSLYDKGTVHPYWGGGTAAARALRANDHMYFELMRHAAARGCTRFDFGRSKLGTGAFAFKKNWGFEPEPLVYASKGEARETNPLSPKYRLQVALWQRLPLWLANRVGPPIARGLG
jgi:FemAB-related protein (PEP-CTERM system-associated)